eukprot:g16279.t1
MFCLFLPQVRATGTGQPQVPSGFRCSECDVSLGSERCECLQCRGTRRPVRLCTLSLSL